MILEKELKINEFKTEEIFNMEIISSNKNLLRHRGLFFLKIRNKSYKN
jgi:hypothetical protein